MRAAIPARLEAHHVATLGTIALGIVVALGATQTWAWQFHQIEGTDTARGIATLAVGITVAILAIVYVLGLLPFRLYAALTASGAATAIALPLSFYADPIGRADPALADALRSYLAPGTTTDAAIGLFMPIIAGALLLLVVGGQTLLRTERGRTVPPVDAAAMVLASLAVGAAFMPWLSGYRWADAGIQHPEGLIAASAGLVAMACTLARIGGMRTTSLAWLEVPAAAILVGGPLLLFARAVGDADPWFDDKLIDCFHYPCNRIDAGVGVYVALISAAGFAVLRCIPPAIGLLSAPPSDSQPATASSDS